MYALSQNQYVLRPFLLLLSGIRMDVYSYTGKLIALPEKD